jgi:hypothetical protein
MASFKYENIPVEEEEQAENTGTPHRFLRFQVLVYIYTYSEAT